MQIHMFVASPIDRISHEISSNWLTQMTVVITDQRCDFTHSVNVFATNYITFNNGYWMNRLAIGSLNGWGVRRPGDGKSSSQRTRYWTRPDILTYIHTCITSEIHIDSHEHKHTNPQTPTHTYTRSDQSHPAPGKQTTRERQKQPRCQTQTHTHTQTHTQTHTDIHTHLQHTHTPHLNTQQHTNYDNYDCVGTSVGMP